jgi:hypothetical protein
VGDVNDDPTTVADTFTANEEEATELDVLANDSDIDGDTLTITAVGTPEEGGTAVTKRQRHHLHLDRRVHRYRSIHLHRCRWQGRCQQRHRNDDRGQYQRRPVAVADSFIVNEDATTSLTPLANDSDVDGDSLTIVAAGVPDQGGTAVPGSTTIAYTPALNFVGTEVFTYTVADGHGGPGDGQHYRDGQQR